MKKALFVFLAIAATVSMFAQGTLIFKTLGIQNAAGTGTYNVPLFANNNQGVGDVPPNSTIGAGTLSGGVTVGLFISGSTTPFATGVLGTTSATGPFIVTPPSQTVAVPGAAPGTTPTITIRAWQGASFEVARASEMQWCEWTLTTKPLGGDPGGGALPITPPTLTGWGPENGSGFELNLFIPEPSAIALAVPGVGALVLARRRCGFVVRAG